MKRRLLLFILPFLLLAILTSSAAAQGYAFNLVEGIADLYLNEDGSARIDYSYTFQNFPGSGPIEFVDVAFPSYTQVNTSSITATVNGQPVSYISTGEYEGDGNGVAIALGSGSIQPGDSGVVQVTIGQVFGLIFQDSSDAEYASINFSPAYFEPASGTTQWTVRIHMPASVLPEEPRWYGAPSGWPEEPETYLDEEGRPTYSWTKTDAQGNREYEFGASFPSKYLPAGTVQVPDVAQSLDTDWGTLTNVVLWVCCIGFFGLIIAVSYRSGQRRKLQYLPPKIAIEGHGIKRGLTAVEAAILLEQPLDKVLTMILFGVIKKEAASVVTQDPLELKVVDPLPETLQPYEVQFLQAFKAPKTSRKSELQTLMIELVKSLSGKMKGFSRKETIAYYKDIVQRAWGQVEVAGTPEVKSAKFDENLEWTMLDKEYDDRTRRVFGPGPVFVPIWWGRYDPGFGRTVVSGPAAPAGGTGGGGFTTPSLPGSAFAGSIVQGVQNFSGKVVGNISDFTGSITNKTNPVPVTTSTRSGGGGGGGGRSGGCACACACAGCACACAGGGR